MKARHIFVISAFIFFSAAIFTSCGEYGGTIIVNNNYSSEIKVTIYTEFGIISQGDAYVPTFFSYKYKYGPETIEAGNNEFFAVSRNTSYTITWSDASNFRHKTIEVANGNIVEVNIP